MPAFLIAPIRTGVQALVGLAAAWLLTKGVTFDTTAIEIGVSSVVIGVVTALLRWLETRFTWLTPLLSLGVSKTGPSY